MPRVIHFEIAAGDAERMMSFYKEIFGWQFQKWEGPETYWLINTGEDGPGINGGFMPRMAPGPMTVNTIGVSSIDASLATVEAQGGKTVVPKKAIPGMGYLAYCNDPEGNIFGLMQMDPAAQ